MSKNLMVTISGVRAVTGETLTPDLISRYSSAFTELIKGKKIVVGNDSRISGDFVKQIVLGSLIAKGFEVIDIGLVPTPTVQIMTEKLSTSGGIVITASHNPIEWNGLKFIDSDGLFLSPEKCERMFQIADQKKFNYSNWDKLGSVKQYTQASQDHIDLIKKLDFINLKAIQSQKFKVAVDTINGAGCHIIPELLKQFSCEVIQINSEATGLFAHKPEPIPEHLDQLSEAVLKHNADFGIAVDPDVDRCVLMDHEGKAIGEEYTLVIATKLMLHHRLGMVVKNMSTTMALDDVAKYYNCLVYESAVGEINVAEKMKEMNAIIGGEGNGGVMLPDIHIGRDAPIAIAMTLAALAEFKMNLKELKASLPQYEIVKEKISIEGKNPEKITSHFKEKYKHEKISELDGLKIYGKSHWVHLRKSNTEPIIRIIAEAKTKDEAQAICSRFMKEIEAV